MADVKFQERRDFERLDRDGLNKHQLTALNQLLSVVLENNPFYADRLGELTLPVSSLEAFRQSIPLLSKEELVAAAAGELPSNRTYPDEAFVRFHRTSGTKGRPLAILDTESDWQAWIETWQFVLDAADVGPNDRALMAFSFGPFIGFWSAYDALAHRGAMVIPAGGMSTLARLELIESSKPTVICCTPTYALRLQEVAVAHGRDLASNSVEKIIVAGEPGGSLPSSRERIESAWRAQVVDHAGATEIGPWGYADRDRSGLHVVEADFLAEYLDTDSQRCLFLDEYLQECPEKPVELVLTALRRYGMPVLRYRTGDLVVPTQSTKTDQSKNQFVLLDGGILGRADDMVVIRGVNVFPSSVEEIIRGESIESEYRIIAKNDGALDELHVELENQTESQLRDLAAVFESRLGFRVSVSAVPLDSLPRFEAKSKRFVDERMGVTK